MSAKTAKKLVIGVAVNNGAIIVSLFVFGTWFGQHPEALFFVSLYSMFGPAFAYALAALSDIV